MMSHERRQADRYPVGVKVEFAGGEGLTRDVSGLGAFFHTDVPFAANDPIEFTMVIPEAVNVRCVGRVVRVENSDGRYGVAVEITSYELAGDYSDDGPAHLVLQELRQYQGAK
jgi:hypothetical protein